MKTVATLPPEEITNLVKLLEHGGIPCTIRIADEQSGLDITELLVEEKDYERACDVIETSQDAAAAERKRKAQRHCPKCNSQSWEPVKDAHYDKAGLAVFRCKECGCLVPGSNTSLHWTPR